MPASVNHDAGKNDHLHKSKCPPPLIRQNFRRQLNFVTASVNNRTPSCKIICVVGAGSRNRLGFAPLYCSSGKRRGFERQLEKAGCQANGLAWPCGLRLPVLMDLYIHPLYVLVSNILSSILNSPAPIHPLYHPLSTLSTVGPTCHFI
jgi:hypothetical protein